MAFSLPGAIAAKLVHPERKVLAAMGDGAFAMSMAEIETAVREGVHIVVLVWVDGGYGLIGWKQEITFGRQAAVCFGNPDFVPLARELRREGVRDRRRRRARADPAHGARRRRRRDHRLPRRLRRERPPDRTPGRAHRPDLTRMPARPDHLRRRSGELTLDDLAEFFEDGELLARTVLARHGCGRVLPSRTAARGFATR